MSVWLVVLGAGLVSVLLRLAPEAWLRGREPPGPLARALPWLPVVVSGVLVAALHVDVPADDRAPYLIAAVPAALTLLVRRSFYLPIVVGAITLALLRRFGPY